MNGEASDTAAPCSYALLVPPLLLPVALGFADAVYGLTAVFCKMTLIVVALRLVRSSQANRRAVHHLFALSIAYLFLLLAALLADHGAARHPHCPVPKASPAV